MSWQGDKNDPKYGATRARTRLRSDAAVLAGNSKKSQVSNVAVMGGYGEEEMANGADAVQDGENVDEGGIGGHTKGLLLLQEERPSMSTSRERSVVSPAVSVSELKLRSSSRNEGDDEEHYDADDIVVQKVDEWLKNRSDSLSSIEFESEMKTVSEEYEFVRLDADVEGEPSETTFVTTMGDIAAKTTQIGDLFYMHQQNGVSDLLLSLPNPTRPLPNVSAKSTSSASSAFPAKGGRELKKKKKTARNAISSCGDVVIPSSDARAVYKHGTAVSQGRRKPTGSPVEAAPDAVADNACNLTHAFVECNGSSTGSADHREREDLEFCETDKGLMLLTPQELERMPESGIEFEESVGPKETDALACIEDSSNSSGSVQRDNPMEHVLDVTVPDLQKTLSQTDIDSEQVLVILPPEKDTALSKSGQTPMSSSGGSSTLATISISTDNDTNTTSIVINTKQGQQSFKINTTNLMQAAATLQPLTLADLVNHKDVTEVSSSLTAEDDKESEKKNSKDPVPQHLPLSDTNKIPTQSCTQDESDGTTICTHTGRCKKVWMCPEPQCGKMYTKQCKLKVHLMMHSGVRPYKCDAEGCDWAFTTIYKLKRHMETHCNAKEFVCDIEGCNRRFTTVYNLKSHKKLHTQPNKVTCPIESCSALFPTRRKMELHMKEHREVDAPYKCPVESCGKTYYTTNSMASHLRVHQRTHLTCTFEGCNKVFDKMSRYKVHMWKHTGERPYVCMFEGCIWAFSSASKLKRHMRKHTGERQYTCEEPGCGKSFMRLEHLQGHMVTHSGDKPFKCPHENCMARFTAKSSLYVHLKKHDSTTEKIVYPCPVENCDKKYNCKSSLRIHMLRYHTPVLAYARQLDYVLVSQEEMPEARVDGEPSTEGYPSTVSVAVQSEEATLTPTDVVDVKAEDDEVSEVMSTATAQAVSVGSDLSSAEGRTIVVPEITISEIRTLCETPVLSSPRSIISDSTVLPSPSDVDSSCFSCVLQENNSGSARTDYCSNHMLVDRVRKRKQLQQAKCSLSSTLESDRRPSAESLILSRPTSESLASSDVVLTSTAIAFHSPTAGTAHFIQNPLLPDDAPPSHSDLYQEDGLLSSMANELAVPISLLTEPSVADATGGDSDYTGSTSVPEFTGTTINLQDLE